MLSRFLYLIQRDHLVSVGLSAVISLLLDGGDRKEQAVLEPLHLLYPCGVSQYPGYQVSLILSGRCGTWIGMGCPVKGFPAYFVKLYLFVRELQNHCNGSGIATKTSS